MWEFLQVIIHVIIFLFIQIQNCFTENTEPVEWRCLANIPDNVLPIIINLIILKFTDSTMLYVI